ncbi:nitroreductase [Streptomyces finlayi]|uniref:Nitroreductase n=1 Tax=Streptomyces finlayi TaxID=67296 RepID=A0A7G7BDG1_9ACTN|nr:nitroreductase family protein [Streptomyces finlayi]QNE73376.1 nitroreductase [Streptomyces finlayi]
MTAQTVDPAVVSAFVADAVAAPSMHNVQPWRFQYMPSTGILRLRMDPARVLPAADPRDWGLHLGCGAALLNLRVAAVHAGWQARFSLLPDAADPELLAEVAFIRPPAADQDLEDLYAALRRRHTNRQPFTDEAVPPEVLDGLKGAAVSEGARLTFLSPWQVETVLELVWDAEHEEAMAPDVREDIDRWTRAGSGRATADGIPEYAFGPRRHGGLGLVRDFAGQRHIEGRETAIFEKTPCLAVLGTQRDRRVDWLHAGQALERVLLQATLDGLATSLSSHALEWPELRWAVRDPRSATGYAQMLLRLGYGPIAPATPRRPVSDVLDII